MASPTIITLSFVVLEIFSQMCKSELLGPPDPHLYTEAVFPPKNPGHGSVVYVPVCRPDCCTSPPSCHHQPPTQSHFTPNLPEKEHIGNLPLQEHVRTYPEVHVGNQRPYYHLSQNDYSYTGSSNQGYHLASDISSKKHHSGSVTVYRQNNGHSSEHKTSIEHHGSGVSHQVFKQTHEQNHYDDLSNQGHDHGYDQSEDLHHKKDHNVNYQFEYSVHDHKTGDVKRHREERKGDVVSGEYSLLEEDGNVRTVKYQADWKSGFHAQVHNSKSQG